MSETALHAISQPAPPRKRPRKVYVSRKLHSVEGVRQEICRLYRDSRKGDLDSLDCHRLANVLHLAARLIAGTELEARVERLERDLSVQQVTVSGSEL